MMPDIHRDQICINVFASFPEDDIKNFFCKDCYKHVFAPDDFSLGLNHLSEKLSISSREPCLNEENKQLLQTACARIIGRDVHKIVKGTTWYKVW